MKQEQRTASCKRREIAAEVALDYVGFHARKDISHLMGTHVLLAGAIKAGRKGCETEANYKKTGKWREPNSYSPTTGDFVIHVGANLCGSLYGYSITSGFVYTNDGKKLTVIGTDYSGKVDFYNIELTDPKIRGYCCPSY